MGIYGGELRTIALAALHGHSNGLVGGNHGAHMPYI